MAPLRVSPSVTLNVACFCDTSKLTAEKAAVTSESRANVDPFQVSTPVFDEVRLRIIPFPSESFKIARASVPVSANATVPKLLLVSANSPAPTVRLLGFQSDERVEPVNCRGSDTVREFCLNDKELFIIAVVE